MLGGLIGGLMEGIVSLRELGGFSGKVVTIIDGIESRSRPI